MERGVIVGKDDRRRRSSSSMGRLAEQGISEVQLDCVQHLDFDDDTVVKRPVEFLASDSGRTEGQKSITFACLHIRPGPGRSA